MEPMEFETLDEYGDTWEDYLDYLEEQFAGLNAPPETYFGQFGKKAQLDDEEEFNTEPYIDEEIIDGMARCLFVNAWADYAEENLDANFSQMELMDVAPETPPESFEKAKQLYNKIEDMNNVDLSDFVPPGIDPDEGFDKENFGHYLCMEALGHGVSWKDDHEDHGLELPHTEAYADMDFGEATLRQMYQDFDKDFPEGDYIFESEPVYEKGSKIAQMEQDLDKSQYQERSEDAVRQSANIPDFGYYGEKDLGNTWAMTFSQHRDSDIMEESNYAVIKSDLEERFPEDVSDERFNHWAVGWVDYLLVKMLDEQGQVTPAGIATLEWVDKLDDYPLADEDDYSEREWNEASENIDNDIKYVLNSEGRDELPDDAVTLIAQWIIENRPEAEDYVREDPRQHSLDEAVILEAMEELGFMEGQEGPPEGKELWRKNPDQRDLFEKKENDALDTDNDW